MKSLRSLLIAATLAFLANKPSLAETFDARMTLSLVNLDPVRDAKIEVGFQGGEARSITGRVITAESMDARPEFGRPDPLVPAKLDKLVARRGTVSVVAPAKSVIVLKLR